MKRNSYVSIVTVVIILVSIFPIYNVHASTNEMNTFYGSLYDQANTIRNYYLHMASGALQERRNEPTIKTKTNLLFASTLLDEYNKGGSVNLRNIAQSIMHASWRYFDEVYTSDNSGWVSLYDFTKNENSYVKSRKFLHDQVLMTLGLALSYPTLDSDDEFRIEYMEGINETLDFIKRNFMQNNTGWVDSLFTTNRTNYSKNYFRIIENICWTIWAVLKFPETVISPISIDNIVQTMNLIHTNGTYKGAVYNVMSPDWSSSDNVLKLRTNTLYGIVNLMLYERTNNTIFLDRGVAIFNFLRSNMYDRGFGGFFDVVDEDGMLLVQRKSVIGNALACLLSSKLSRFFPTNETIKATLVRTNRFIEENLLNRDSGVYYITCERTGLPLSEHSLMSDTIRLFQRSNSLHIINGSISSKVSVGEKIKLDLHLSNQDNLNYTVFIEGSKIKPFNLTSTDSYLSIHLDLKDNVEIGFTDVIIKLKILSGTLDQQNSLEVQIGSDRRLPQGLVYLIALGLLVGIVIVVRYPPKKVEEFLVRLSSIGTVEEAKGETKDEKTAIREENDTPQKED